MREMRRVFFLANPIAAVLLFLPLLLLQGCGGESGSTAAAVSEQDRVIGIARTSAPIANSSLSFYEGAAERDPQIEGVPVATATTNENGLFLSNAFSSKNFRVTASGGTLDGKPIIGTLRAHVRNYKFGETVHINGVTTLVSAYFDATPGITLEEAETAVGNFLQLSGTELGSAYAPEDGKAFSHVVFHEEASDETHVNAFIDSLVVEMKANNSATHHFKGTTSNSASAAKGMNSRALSNEVRARRISEAVVMDALTGIAKAALGKAGDIALSKLLTEVGYVDAETATKNALDQIKSELHALENQVSAVNQNVLKGTYQTIVSGGGIQILLDNIESNIGNFATLSRITPADYANSQSYYDQLVIQRKTDLRNLTTGSANIQLHNVMVGTTPGSLPLISLFGKIVKDEGNRAFYNKQDSDDYFTVMHWWQNKQIALFGLILAQLDMDGAPLTGPASKTEAVDLFSGDMSDVQQPAVCEDFTQCTPAFVIPGAPAKTIQLGIQNAMFKQPVPVGTVIEKARSIMWYVGTGSTAPKDFYFTTFTNGKAALVQLNKTHSFNNWGLSRAYIPTVTDQNWALFSANNIHTPYCVKNDKPATLANLHAQGWPLWTEVNRIGGDQQGLFIPADPNRGTPGYWLDVMWPYELNECDYARHDYLGITTGYDNLHTTYLYDFIPFREMPEGIGTYLW